MRSPLKYNSGFYSPNDSVMQPSQSSTAPRVSLIAAVARNGVIGRGNALPWHLPQDLKRFRALTTGHPIIMGRRTYESLGRPLPNRHNLVVTRDPHFAAAGCSVAASLEAAIAACAGATDEIFIIGGAQIYRQALPLAQRLYLTEIDQDFEGDTHFPPFDRRQWRETAREVQAGAEVPFAFVIYERT